jgi:hypothetical protein
VLQRELFNREKTRPKRTLYTVVVCTVPYGMLVVRALVLRCVTFDVMRLAYSSSVLDKCDRSMM